MPWDTIEPTRRPGQGGPGRKPAGDVSVYFHRTGRNPAAGMSLVFTFSPSTVDRAGVRSGARHVEILVDRTQKLLRFAPRIGGARKMRPPANQGGVRWSLTCSHSGQMQGLFPRSMFAVKKTQPLALIESSSEGITVALPEIEGGAA